MEAEEILAALDRNVKERRRLHEELEKLTSCYRCVHRELCNFALQNIGYNPKMRSKRYPLCDYYELRA